LLPSVFASELEQVARDALQTAFHPTKPGFKGLIDRFLADRQRLVKGRWAHNTAGVLRYLVVDEFHSFDGAQGTDLASLIRRLRDRLGGPGAESKAEMLSYAGQIFAGRFEPNSLIEEEQLSPEEFFTAPTAFGEEAVREILASDAYRRLVPAGLAPAEWAAGYLERAEAQRVGSTAGGSARISP
jgi:hypothetical protein